MQIGLSDMTILHAEFSVLDHDGCLSRLLTGEREVERASNPADLPGWKTFGMPFRKAAMLFGRSVLPTCLIVFVRKSFDDVILGIQRLLTQIVSSFSCRGFTNSLRCAFRSARNGPMTSSPAWTNCQAVRGFVVCAERQTLPHRGRLRIGDPTAIVVGVLALGHLLDPIGELLMNSRAIVRIAGREVEIPLR